MQNKGNVIILFLAYKTIILLYNVYANKLELA